MEEELTRGQELRYVCLAIRKFFPLNFFFLVEIIISLETSFLGKSVMNELA